MTKRLMFLEDIKKTALFLVLANDTGKLLKSHKRTDYGYYFINYTTDSQTAWQKSYLDKFSWEAVVFTPVQILKGMLSFFCSKLHQAA